MARDRPTGGLRFLDDHRPLVGGMTRIAQLANFYSPTSGGLRVAVDALRDGYAANGHLSTLVVPGERHWVSTRVIEIGSPRLFGGGGYRVITSRQAVFEALDRVDPDIVEVHDKLLQRWAWTWAQARGRPVVVFSHERLDATLAEYLPRLAERHRRRLAGYVARRVVRDSDCVVTCSAFAAAEFPDSPTVRTIALGVDLARFRPAQRVEIRPTVRLITVGRLSAEKRADVAIGALARLLERGIRAELVLVGSGPLESRLRRQADGLPVRFAGFVGVAQVADEVAAADIFLAPGPGETFGLAALEALACGTPTVTVVGAATAEFVSGNRRAGRAVPLDAAEFAGAAAELLELPLDVRRAAARSVAENFSWKRTVDAMLELHAELLARPECAVVR